ncbi:MAG TPA: transcriptional regulator GcvA [Rhodocyclaceae bacterium]
MSHFPPLKALRAFESAGRHLSFQKAAAELHVTPAAISHQIKLLEEHLGTPLFSRMTRRIKLTAAGRHLLPELADGFARIAAAVARVRSSRRPGTLSIAVPPLFASKWLMPRLHAFVSAFPDLELKVSTGMHLVDAHRDLPVPHARGDSEEAPVDIAIRFGSGRYPGCRAMKLFDVSFTPLCSPRLPTTARPLRSAADLAHHPLLHDDLHHLSDGWASWASWFEAAGIENLARRRGPHFSQPILGLDAAIDGAGVVLGSRELAAADLAAGRLLAPIPIAIRTGASYYAVCCEDEADDPRIAGFMDWLLREVKTGRAMPAGRKARATSS